MASEWVKLTLQDGGKTIHGNLANVSSAFVRVIKSAAFGPREFEPKFHKRALKDGRQSVALAVARFR